MVTYKLQERVGKIVLVCAIMQPSDEQNNVATVSVVRERKAQQLEVT